jgi:hypothetical protein
MDIIVRKATIEDLDWLIVELKKFSNFYRSHKYNLFNGDYWQAGLTVMIKDHVVLISENSAGIRTGLIAGFLVNHPFNPEIKCLMENLWWVAKEFRHTRSALLLINEFIRIGKECGNWITMTLQSNSPVNDKCLLNRGFKKNETSYLMEN